MPVACHFRPALVLAALWLTLAPASASADDVAPASDPGPVPYPLPGNTDMPEKPVKQSDKHSSTDGQGVGSGSSPRGVATLDTMTKSQGRTADFNVKAEGKSVVRISDLSQGRPPESKQSARSRSQAPGHRRPPRGRN